MKNILIKADVNVYFILMFWLFGSGVHSSKSEWRGPEIYLIRSKELWIEYWNQFTIQYSTRFSTDLILKFILVLQNGTNIV